MEDGYINFARLFKVLADPKRLKIVKLLYDKEMCGCDLLEEFHITQPTLSHDMRLLSDTGLVKVRKDGKWSYYSLNHELLKEKYEKIGSFLLDK